MPEGFGIKPAEEVMVAIVIGHRGIEMSTYPHPPTEAELMRKENLKMEHLDGLDVYSIDEFWDIVDTGAFIPSDGSGYYARIDEEGKIIETEASVWHTPARGDILVADCVVWYNK